MGWPQWVAQAGSLVLLFTYLALPVITISDYYRDSTANGATNEGYLRFREALRAAGACGSPVYVEDVGPLTAGSPQMPTMFALEAMNYVLTLENCGSTVMSLSEIRQQLALHPENWVIIQSASAAALSGQYDLQPIASFSAPEFGSTFVPIGLYSIVPHP